MKKPTICPKALCILPSLYMEAGLSYSFFSPAFHANYPDLHDWSLLTAAALVLGATFVPWTRQRLIRPVLGLLWVQIALLYYWETVGGWLGIGMAGVCLAEAILLLVNLEDLWISGKIGLNIDYFPIIVNLKTLNSAIGCFGAFTLLVSFTQVLPTLLSDPFLPNFPSPHLLFAFTFLLLSMSVPSLRSSIALLHSLTVSRLPLFLYLLELSLYLSDKSQFPYDQLIVCVLLTAAYSCRFHPQDSETAIPALPAAKGFRDVLIEQRPWGDGGEQGGVKLAEFEDEEGYRGHEFFREEAHHLLKIPAEELKSI